MLDCSVGVMAYNEEANVASALRSMLCQEMSGARVTEVIVVASGCTDRTVDIVADLPVRSRGSGCSCSSAGRARRRRSTCSSSAASAPVLLLVSADVIVADGAFGHLLHHFADPAVGMVEAALSPSTARHLPWPRGAPAVGLHDVIARQTPKLGEAIAFRNVVPSIPLDTASMS